MTLVLAFVLILAGCVLAAVAHGAVLGLAIPLLCGTAGVLCALHAQRSLT